METNNNVNAQKADFQIVMSFPLTIYESDSDFSSSDWMLEMGSRESAKDQRSENSRTRSRASQLAQSALSDDDYSHISSVQQRFSKAEINHMNEAALLVRRRISSNNSLEGFELYRALNACKRYHQKLTSAIEELLNYDKNCIPVDWINAVEAMSRAIYSVKSAPASSLLRLIEDRNVYGLSMKLKSQNEETSSQASMALLEILRSGSFQVDDDSNLLGQNAVELFDFEHLLNRSNNTVLDSGLRLLSALITVYLVPFKNLEDLKGLEDAPTKALAKLMCCMSFVTTCDANIVTFVSGISQEELMVVCRGNLSHIWFAMVEPLLQVDSMEVEDNENPCHSGQDYHEGENQTNEHQQELGVNPLFSETSFCLEFDDSDTDDFEIDRNNTNCADGDGQIGDRNNTNCADGDGQIGDLIPEVLALANHLASFLEEAKRLRVEALLYRNSESVHDNMRAALLELVADPDEIDAESYELL